MVRTQQGPLKISYLGRVQPTLAFHVHTVCIQTASKDFPHSLNSATKRGIFGEAQPPSMPFAIELPYTNHIVQVAENDFPSRMTWYDAMKGCQNLGNGWRLPSIEELNAMYSQLHKNGKGTFKTGALNSWYWSGEEFDVNNALSLDFFLPPLSSVCVYNDKFNMGYVRAVRTLP